MSPFHPDAVALDGRADAPLPGLVLRVLLALLAGALSWAWLARLDVIAVAQGRIVSQSQLQIVQPAESGVVRELLVREGALVQRGQVLARFDTRLAEADLRQLRNELQLRALQLRRIDAELRETAMVRAPGDPPELFAQVQEQHRARRAAHLDAIEAERAIVNRAEQELRGALEVEAKLNRTLPIFRQQEQAFARLSKDGFAGELMMLDKQRDRIEREQDLAAQQFSIAGLRSAVAQGNRRIAQIQSNYRQALHNERIDAEAQQHRVRQELDKHSHRRELLELRSPQDGIVKDLATRTIGSVVAAGTVLMTVVPRNEPLQAEVWIADQDAGLVAVGQSVRLKLPAFPFQRFGTLPGEIAGISPDATEIPAVGRQRNDAGSPGGASGYRALIALHAQHLELEGRRHRLYPGMQTSAEIVLGTRSVLEYILLPLHKALHEAAREP